MDIVDDTEPPTLMIPSLTQKAFNHSGEGDGAPAPETPPPGYHGTVGWLPHTAGDRCWGST